MIKIHSNDTTLEIKKWSKDELWFDFYFPDCNQDPKLRDSEDFIFTRDEILNMLKMLDK
jgi:hypothetical protein